MFGNKRIFIVDDEVLIAMALEAMVEDLGCVVAGSTSSLEEAIVTARTVQADAAILDVRLGASNSLEVARILADRGVAIIYATGYSTGAPPDGWPDGRVLVKPFVIAGLEETLADVLQARRQA